MHLIPDPLSGTLSFQLACSLVDLRNGADALLLLAVNCTSIKRLSPLQLLTAALLQAHNPISSSLLSNARRNLYIGERMFAVPQVNYRQRHSRVMVLFVSRTCKSHTSSLHIVLE